MSSVYSLDEGGRLAGAVRLVSLVQADPAGLLEEITNLITVPVVDAGARMIGIITVDDVLEDTLPGARPDRDGRRQRRRWVGHLRPGRPELRLQPAVGAAAADPGQAFARRFQELLTSVAVRS
jgi:CBS-domain-containing membrane protein